MLYEFVKVAHIFSVILWVGGTLMVPFVLISLSGSNSGDFVNLRKAYRAVHTPAMIGTWVFGLILTEVGGWMPSGWLFGKLFLVILLSGFHGFWSAQIRKASWDAQVEVPSLSLPLAWFQFIAVLIIVGLVVLKPF